MGISENSGGSVSNGERDNNAYSFDLEKDARNSEQDELRNGDMLDSDDASMNGGIAGEGSVKTSDKCSDDGEDDDDDDDETDTDDDQSINVGESMDDDGELEDLNHNFRIGDFVWGKSKRRQWWPGQICDPTDDSLFDLKHRRDENRLLVAFFGDNSSSWCLPSQLIPFVENFNEKSTASSSDAFQSAVQAAFDEVSRVIESEMTCNCASIQSRADLVPIFGVKGVLTFPDHVADEILAALINFARTVSFDSLLELAVVRGWLSSSSFLKDRFRLPAYYSYHVEGMEDKSKNGDKPSEDFSVPIEVPILGPSDEDWPSPSAKLPESATDRIYHRRKQKSVADLLRESDNVKSRSQRKAPPAKHRRDTRKSSSSVKSLKSVKKRKIEISKSPKSENGELVDIKAVKDDTVTPAENNLREESESVSTPRERKVSKYLSYPYIIPEWKVGYTNFKSGSETSKTSKKDLPIQEEPELEASSSQQKSVANTSSDKEHPFDETTEQSKSASPDSRLDHNDAKMSFPVSDVSLSPNELLLGIQNAALDPLYLSKEGTLDEVWGFASAFRSSMYVHGSDYPKNSKGRKRKLTTGTHTDEKKPYKQPKKPSCEVKMEGKSSIVLSFSPRFPIPSKEDIVKVFSEYGSLNIDRTDVTKDSYSAQVVYVNEHDAESAFKSSSDVKLRLKGCSSTKPHKTPPASAANPESDLTADVQAIKRKFDIMAAILANYHSKFSVEEKRGLKDELKHVMASVEVVSDKVRELAETYVK